MRENWTLIQIGILSALSVEKDTLEIILMMNIITTVTTFHVLSILTRKEKNQASFPSEIDLLPKFWEEVGVSVLIVVVYLLKGNSIQGILKSFVSNCTLLKLRVKKSLLISFPST